MTDNKLVVKVTYSLMSVLYGMLICAVVCSVFIVAFGFLVHVKAPVLVFSFLGKMYAGKNFTFGENVLSAMYLLLKVGASAYGVYLIRAVLKAIYFETTFEQKNVNRLKNLARLIMFTPLVLGVIEGFLSLSQIKINKITNLTPHLDVGIKVIYFFNYDFFTYVILGGLIYSLALVFESGKFLKQENDLTV